MDSRKTMIRYKVESFFKEVSNHPKVREQIELGELFEASIQLNQYYEYTPKQLNYFLSELIGKKYNEIFNS
jgi:hypothetical protein